MKSPMTDSIVGLLVTQTKYRFADHNLIAEVVRDTVHAIRAMRDGEQTTRRVAEPGKVACGQGGL